MQSEERGNEVGQRDIIIVNGDLETIHEEVEEFVVGDF